nr:hypothetical protein [uncultured Duganella sp.]
MNHSQNEAHRVFEMTVTSAKALINKGVPPGYIIAGLLGVVAAIGSDAVGTAETARALRLVAADLEKTGLDTLQ